MPQNIPVFFQYLWFGAALFTLIGAILWTLFFFWPILRFQRRMMIRGYRLQLKMIRDMKATKREVRRELQKRKKSDPVVRL